jgi:hypothetical protein
MLTDVRQNELDLAEERLFTGLFGSTTLDAKAQWLLKFLGIDINDLIQNFEGVVKPLMDDDGLVNAELARSLVSTKSPLLSNIIPTYNFRLVDVSDGVVELLKGLLNGRI